MLIPCSHDGGAETFGIEVTFFPDVGFGVITMANSPISSDAIGEILTYKLVDDKIGLAEDERSDWAGKYG